MVSFSPVFIHVRTSCVSWSQRELRAAILPPTRGNKSAALTIALTMLSKYLHILSLCTPIVNSGSAHQGLCDTLAANLPQPITDIHTNALSICLLQGTTMHNHIP